MLCLEAWEPVGKCFDRNLFECIDFHGLSQIIASLTRERLAEREAEICNFPWTQTEKDDALGKCRLGLRAWRSKKSMLCLHAVTHEDGHPLENEHESGMAEGYVNIGIQISKDALKAKGTIAMRLSCGTSRKHLMTFAGKLQKRV